MEYIIKKDEIPNNPIELQNSFWFNMYSRQQFPYKELLAGDILYWYDSIQRAIIWKSKVTDIVRFPYNSKKEILSNFKNISKDNYFHEKTEGKGYFINYKVEVVEKVFFNKPENYNFPRLGWVRVDKQISEKWLIEYSLEENNNLDNIVSNNTLTTKQQLSELNKKMQFISPNRIEKLVSSTIRNDTKIINKLKEIVNYKCQFPNCGIKIKKKNGGFYIEVAHIKPVSKGGQSVLGNLLVLCPNHHKEFDYGKLIIHEQTEFSIKGKLNDRLFEIKMVN